MIIYPSYFNRKYSKKQGRKVPRALASDPTPEKIENALKKLNIKYEIQNKQYSKHWFEDRTRFYIDTNKKKGDLLKEIAKIIKS
ncbi:MAG: signal recognition particle subunit SRP19/SEC65 family protein [Thermoplasmata archaeon]|nr:signal recognition particle subunit SRP19/SEC65 family protein [Thermoplasmata archaeon]